MIPLTLGARPRSSLVAASFDERDPAVLFMRERAINACGRAGKHVGICGQRPQ